jgi:HAD superfamily hydrolase (TIGR01490 family)
MSSPRAVLFDMDRTLVRVDTSALYARYQRERRESSFFWTARVSYWLMLHRLGLLDLEKAIERAYLPLKGRSEAWLVERADDWFKNGVAEHISEAARSTVKRHRDSGDLIAIVTGQTSYLTAPVAKELGVEHVIATQLQVEDGRLTGKVLTPVSYGRAKVALAEALASRQGLSLDSATFYSDSASDLPLLERVHTPVAVNPEPRLRKIAAARGWTIESW